MSHVYDAKDFISYNEFKEVSINYLFRIKPVNKRLRYYYLLFKVLLFNKDNEYTKVINLFKKLYNENILVEIDGVKFSPSPYIIDWAHEVFIGVLEPNTYNYFNNTRGNLFVNVGANLGGYSLRAGKKYSKVIAIEANPHIAEELRKNVELNRFFNIEVLNLAIWKSKDKVKLYKSIDDNNLVSSLTPYRMKEYEYRDYFEVEADTLDNVLVNYDRIDLILIDAEGSEVEVLEGSVNTLEKTRNVIVEVKPGITDEKVITILKNNGFSVSFLDKEKYYANVLGKKEKNI
ncbi:FkbM family methyltransferase [Sulfolobus sp. A20-N-F6]|nr:FkbM family methyltransferase [Sulfolobus sp. A20-N-F8]TRM82731.1 FkbM family methyltransferase [Sulfolobus sp. A20-N-F6]TRM89580.1 FkbM family methyltransferase [Sulfolobus sp. C3]TRM99085.1 FkbM family methyltransferase [Sulfolobus sp. F1]TRN01374.1 FkbM family methyltransferase [Sulfolobus sp. E1]